MTSEAPTVTDPDVDAMRRARMNASGTITLMVRDEAGRPVGGALVTYGGPPGLMVPGAAMATAPDGSYRIDSLIPGTYTVGIEAEGFEAARKTDIVLTAGQEARVDLVLRRTP